MNLDIIRTVIEMKESIFFVLFLGLCLIVYNSGKRALVFLFNRKDGIIPEYLKSQTDSMNSMSDKISMQNDNLVETNLALKDLNVSVRGIRDDVLTIVKGGKDKGLL